MVVICIIYIQIIIVCEAAQVARRGLKLMLCTHKEPHPLWTVVKVVTIGEKVIREELLSEL